MAHGHGKKRRKAGGETLPTDDQTAVLLLKPGQGPLSLETRHRDLDRAAARFLGFPHAFGDLRPATTFAQLLAQVFGVIPCIGSDDLRPFAGASTLASPQADLVQQRHDLCALIPIRRRCTVRQGHAASVCETVDEDALTLAAMGHALTAAFARGKTIRRRPRTATESARVPQRSQGSGLAWP